TADVDRNHRGGVGADPRLDVGRVERHRLGVAVDEDDARAGMDRGRRGREEGVRGDDDLTAFDVERPQDDLEGTGARAHRDRVLRRMPFRERGFELAADGPQRELTRGEGLVDTREDFGAVFGREAHPRRGYAHEHRIYRSTARQTRL